MDTRCVSDVHCIMCLRMHDDACSMHVNTPPWHKDVSISCRSGQTSAPGYPVRRLVHGEELPFHPRDQLQPGHRTQHGAIRECQQTHEGI